MKDYTNVKRITSIEKGSMEPIQEWLVDMEILYGEGMHPFSWPKILADIKKDPFAFVEQGGWTALCASGEHEDRDSEEERQEKEEDSDFKAGEDSSGKSDEDDDYSVRVPPKTRVEDPALTTAKVWTGKNSRREAERADKRRKEKQELTEQKQQELVKKKAVAKKNLTSSAFIKRKR